MARERAACRGKGPHDPAGDLVRGRLELGESARSRLEEGFHLVERGERAARLLRPVEVGRQRLGHLGQRPALLADHRRELVAPLLLQVGVVRQDLRRRADRRDPREHPVHRFAEERVVGQPVRQRLRLQRRRPLRARQRRERARPSGMTPDQLARAFGVHAQRRNRRLVRNLVQRFQEPAFPRAVEVVEPEVERSRGPAQQLSGDPALVALDQVQVGGRDPDPPRQLGLCHAERPAAFPDPRPKYRPRHLSSSPPPGEL